MAWPTVGRQGFPDKNGSGETDDHSSVFQKVDGNKVLVTLAEVLDCAKENEHGPFQCPPQAEKKRESPGPLKTRVLPYWVVGFSFDEVQYRC